MVHLSRPGIGSLIGAATTFSRILRNHVGLLTLTECRGPVGMADIKRTIMGARENKINTHSVYIFRCGESGIYAFTVDRTGQVLPRIYPRVRWTLDRQVTLGRDSNAAKQESIKTMLDAIGKRGFYLSFAGTKSVGLLDEWRPDARSQMTFSADVR